MRRAARIEAAKPSNNGLPRPVRPETRFPEGASYFWHVGYEQGLERAKRAIVPTMSDKIKAVLGFACGLAVVYVWTVTALGKPLWFPFQW